MMEGEEDVILELASLMNETSTNITDFGNATLAASSYGQQFPRDMLGFTAACAFIIAILGATGNLLTIVALPMCKKLRTTATAFVVNLAVVELLFCIFILPLSGAQYAFLQYYGQQLLTDSECVIFTSGRYAMTQIQLQTVVAIALTRAIAVGCPRLYQRINNNYCIVVWIVCIWIYSILIRLPSALGIFGSYTFNTNSMECDISNIDANKLPRNVAMVVEVLIPLAFIIGLYIYIFVKVMQRSCQRHRRLRKSSPFYIVKGSSARVRRASMGNNLIPSDDQPTKEDATGDTTDGGKSNTSFKSLKRMVSQTTIKMSRRSSNINNCLNNNRRDMRVARTIFIIFIIMFICTVPVGFVHAVDRDGKRPIRFLAVHILYWLQYCLNVIVYVLLNRQYRDAYIDLLVKLIPTLQRHKGFMFPWENASTVATKGSSFRKPSMSQGDTTKQQQQRCSPPANGCLPIYETKLDAIPEMNSMISSGNDNEELLPLQENLADVNENKTNPYSSEKNASPLPIQKLSEPGNEEEKQLWINKSGQHVSEPSSDVEEKV